MQTRKLPSDLTNLYLLQVLEHIITSNTMSYPDQNNLLFHNQNGFRSRVSCETQLIQFTQDLQDTLNQGGQTDVKVMDFSKALIKDDHQRLLRKLHRLSINTTVNAWINSIFVSFVGWAGGFFIVKVFSD